MSKTKLLPCPFCGREAHVYRFDRLIWHVECKHLGEDDEKDRCNGIACAWGGSKAQAIEKWNTRAHNLYLANELKQVVGRWESMRKRNLPDPVKFCIYDMQDYIKYLEGEPKGDNQ